jgi:phosphoribosylaminoimidazolecarboxamide formyltransferase / IMP cyclohydrolase
MDQKRKIKRALISVYDKTGLVEFARALVDEFGIEIISTGGTARHLKENSLPVTLVEDITGFPEMLDGRVKTLHPKIHAGILADRDNPEHMRQLAEQGIEPIDMVVVNLYPFEKTVADPNCTFEQAIEMIDIGGPTMLRAAAKNHKHVTPLCQPSQWGALLDRMRGFGGRVAEGFCRDYASEVFQSIQQYDSTVARYLQRVHPFKALLPHALDLYLQQSPGMTYGENPHQSAGRFSIEGVKERTHLFTDRYPDDYERSMSFNNYNDASAAYELCGELHRSLGSRHEMKSCVFIKHTNACGCGIAPESYHAYRRAYTGDVNAAMGGILACSFDIDKDFADSVLETYGQIGKHNGAGGFFVEVWVAPSFDEKAIRALRESSKSWGARVRLLTVGQMDEPPSETDYDYRKITDGMLVQVPDLLGLNEDQWKVETKRKPSEGELADLRLAWLIAKHTKSNAISICKDGMLIGNGAGQMSRVMSCRIATWLAKENRHEDKLKGSVAASDAFFPFPDGPNILIDAGVTAIIQPGGSKNDDKVIAACDDRDVAMIFTGTRHFKH